MTENDDRAGLMHQPGGPSDHDVLIARIIDAEGADNGGAAWAEFARVAARDPAAWAELADAQRRHSALARAVSREIRVADEVELPTHDSAGVSHRARVAMRAARWGGWAVAACLAGAWATSTLTGGLSQGAGQGAQLVDWRPSTQEALSAFLDAGQKSGEVVGQVPEFVLLETNPVVQGRGFEVVYMRQIVERRIVPDLYRAGSDELGRAVPVRSSIPPKSGGSM